MTKKILATILVTAMTITMLASCTSKDADSSDTGSSSQVQSSSKVEFTPTPITPTPPKKEEPKTDDTPKTTENVTKPKVDKDVTIVIDKDAGKQSKADNKINVKAKPLSVKKSPTISISNKTLTIVKGNTANIKAVASNKGKVSYSSSNPKTVNVSSSGKVTAKATGKAIITACLSDSKNIKATCVVTVTNKAGNTNTGKKPKDGEKKVVDGKTYIYSTWGSKVGVPKLDGWVEFQTHCDKCEKLLEKCICQQRDDEFIKNYECETCGKGWNKCKHGDKVIGSWS